MVGIGTRVGPFELVEQLARGDRVSLYRAVRTDGVREPRQAAIRIVHDPRDVGAVSLVRKEYELLRSLDDPRIRRTFAFYASHGAAALEWVDGPTLAAVMRLSQNGFVDFDTATRIDVLIEVAYALRHAHSASRTDMPICHGRINPRTVRFGADGRVVLVDFGLSTREVDFVLPPEAAMGALDPNSDQWLLGALAVELLTGEPVLPPGSDARTLDVDRVVTATNKACPPMARVVARMLAQDPTQRYFPDAAMLKEMLAAQRQVPGISRRSELISLAIRRRTVAEPLESTLPTMRSPVSVTRELPRPAPMPAPMGQGHREEGRPKLLYTNQQQLVNAVMDEGADVLEIPLAGGPGYSRGINRRDTAPLENEAMPTPSSESTAPPAVIPRSDAFASRTRPEDDHDSVSATDWWLLGSLLLMFVGGLAMVAWRFWT